MAKPRYKLRREAWIDNAIQPAGTEITYEGKPGYNLEPVNAEALAMYEKYNPQPEGVPQIKVETASDTGWESKALAAGWSPPGFAKVAESTPAPAPSSDRGSKPAAATAASGQAGAGGNQGAAGKAGNATADI